MSNINTIENSSNLEATRTSSEVNPSSEIVDESIQKQNKSDFVAEEVPSLGVATPNTSIGMDSSDLLKNVGIGYQLNVESRENNGSAGDIAIGALQEKFNNKTPSIN